MIKTWLLEQRGRNQIRFEREDLAIGAAFDIATTDRGTTVCFPDGTVYVVIKAHPSQRIQIVTEVF